MLIEEILKAINYLLVILLFSNPIFNADKLLENMIININKRLIMMDILFIYS